jgi:4-diphosphocytidyl-2-C-methyl-D-erythritol kinase
VADAAGASVTEPAAAKVNLFLRVAGQRPDGYHDIETLVQPVTLADGVRVQPADGISLRVVGDMAREVPSGDGNLVVMAARALARRCGGAGGASMLLVKRIPVSAGLGGGSADAAAALRALHRLWACELGWEQLAAVAAEVGSDVPALVPGGPVLARGRGEQVEGVRTARSWWVLVTLGFPVRSGEAYGWWDEDGADSGPDPGALVEAATQGKVEELGTLVFNDLERPVAARHPQIGEATRRLRDAGALGAVMCGSGPTVAGLARDGAHAEEIAASMGGMVVSSMTGLSGGIPRPVAS